MKFFFFRHSRFDTLHYYLSLASAYLWLNSFLFSSCSVSLIEQLKANLNELNCILNKMWSHFKYLLYSNSLFFLVILLLLLWDVCVCVPTSYFRVRIHHFYVCFLHSVFVSLLVAFNSINKFKRYFPFWCSCFCCKFRVIRLHTIQEIRLKFERQ